MKVLFSYQREVQRKVASGVTAFERVSVSATAFVNEVRNFTQKFFNIKH